MSDDDLIYDTVMRDISKLQAPGAADSVPVAGPRIIPPVLYLPMREVADGQHIAEVRKLPDGRRVGCLHCARSAR
ncbi:hypothetical protein GCM10022198_16180 [Klugiella xanthotipulae]|uniref:hypothetical protein n=1 Tax=Klugiella xanthotipulae TaxID=244735 RepID=UPI001FE4CA42|nr:hypothetical protein [Klugiella xanthotipulae]